MRWPWSSSKTIEPAIEPLSPLHIEEAYRSAVALREAAVKSIREANELTEREVLAAGACINRLVDTANQQIESITRLVHAAKRDPGQSLIDCQIRETQSFLSALHRSLDDDLRNAEQSQRHAEVISDTSRRVAALASQAKLLAINARIEAAHAGSEGGAFSILAEEMRRLAEEISSANAVVEGLARSVSDLAPRVQANVVDLKTRTDQFSKRLQQDLKATDDARKAASARVEEVVTGSEHSSRAILESAFEALSHLQFQDPVAQGIMRIDGHLYQHQIDLCEALALKGREREIPEPMHRELGGDKPIEAENHGLVQLF